MKVATAPPLILLLASALWVAPAAVAQTPDKAVASGGLSKPCPDASAIITPQKLGGAIRALRGKLGKSGSGYYVQKLSRARKASTAGLALQQCGAGVLRKSVYVRIHPRGVQCGSCATGFFMSKFPGAGWRIWFID